MSQGKEILLTAIEKKLSTSIAIDTEITTLKNEKDLLEKILNNQSENYDYEFIKDLDEKETAILVDATDQSDQDKNRYCGIIYYLKKMIIRNMNLVQKIPLTDKQVELIYQLRALIEARYDSISKMVALKEDDNNDIEGYRKLKEKITNNELFDQSDYDLIKQLLKGDVDINYGFALNEVMTFLNDYNAELLINKNVDLTKTTDPEDLSLKLAEKKQKIKEIMAVLSFDFDTFDEYNTNLLLSITDLEKLEQFAHYLVDSNFINYFKEKNIRGVCHLLKFSSQETIEYLIDTLKNEYKLNDGDIKGIVNRGIFCFDDSKKENTVAIFEFLKQNGINTAKLKELIKTDISIFYVTNAEAITKAFEVMASKNYDVNKILNGPISVLKNGLDTLLHNIDVLEKYGFDLSVDSDFDSFSVLSSGELETCLDSFIELGLNEYIHNSPTIAVRTIRTEIIKRIHYCYTHNIPIWQNSKNSEQKRLNGVVTGNNFEQASSEDVDENIPKTDREDNEDYDYLISNANHILSESEIKDLIVGYPILENIELNYGYVPSADDSLGNIRQRTELRFGNKVISRQKTYRIFKILIDTSVPEKEALLYALTYGSILTQEEYDAIKTAVMGNGMGEKKL